MGTRPDAFPEVKARTHAEDFDGEGLPPLGGVLAVGLCGVVAFLTLYATQPLLPLFARLFHASKAAVGMTVSASTLGVALAAPIIGSLAERLSRKRVIVGSVVALSVPTLLAASSPGLGVLVTWRFLEGLALPGVFAISIAYVTEEWPARSVPFVMSVYISGTALGGFLGRMISGLSAEYLGWRWSFSLLGVATLLGAAAIAHWLPGERLRALNTTSPGSIYARPSQPETVRLLHLGRRLLPHLGNRRLVATFAVGFSVLFSLVAVFTYITFYLAEAPFYLSTAALSYLFVVYLVGLVVTPFAGYLIARVGLQRGIALSVALSMAGVAITLVHSLAVVIAGLALVSTGVFISQATATSFLREAAPAGARASAAGLYLSCYYLGGTAAGVVPSYIWAHGRWPACALAVMLLQVFTLVVALVGWRSTGAQPQAG